MATTKVATDIKDAPTTDVGRRDVHLGSLGQGMISGFTRRWGLVVKSSRVVGSGQGLLFSMLLRRDITGIPGIVGTNRSHQLIAISTSRWSQCRLWSPMFMAGYCSFFFSFGKVVALTGKNGRRTLKIGGRGRVRQVVALSS